MRGVGIMPTVRTYIIDANRLSRDGLSRIFSGSKFEIVGEGKNLESLAHRPGPSNEKPELVLIDIATLEGRVNEGIAALRNAFEDAFIVTLANQEEANLLFDCFRAGVEGCLLKDISGAALMESLDLVLLGERVFPSQLVTMLMEDGTAVQNGGSNEALLQARLSEREIQILHCLVNGSSNKAIANRLDVAEATVKVHLKSILRKIKAQNRTQAAIWAMNHGLGGCDASEHHES